MKQWYKNFAAVLLAISSLSCCSRSETASPKPDVPAPQNEVEVWLTKGDESVKLKKQPAVLNFSSQPNSYRFIDIDPARKFQTVEGFGYTLTGGSAEVISRLSEAKRNELLQELFRQGEASIGVSYLRLSIGASDLNSEVFSYNDLAPGETDLTLSKFSLAKDQVLIDLLKKILAINPNIKIIATPWSPPVWMKTNYSSVGGSLQTNYYDVYAQYFVKYILAMQQNGIKIHAVTPQNEPLHPGNNPSMYMPANEQANFIKNSLGPAFVKAGINTKIIIYDHNLDRPDYPTAILSDPETAKYVDGTAFHLYAGNIDTMGNLHDTFPGKNLYFTEQYTAANGNFGGDLSWHIKNVIIGSMRNWSVNALEWNLANDQNYKPHTPGGCDTCKGAVTIAGSDTYSRNVSYYIIAHASKFVPPGSVRIHSSPSGTLNHVAFSLPNGKIALIVQNENANTEMFNIRLNGKWVTVSLDAASVATYVF